MFDSTRTHLLNFDAHALPQHLSLLPLLCLGAQAFEDATALRRRHDAVPVAQVRQLLALAVDPR